MSLNACVHACWWMIVCVLNAYQSFIYASGTLKAAIYSTIKTMKIAVNNEAWNRFPLSRYLYFNCPQPLPRLG